MEDRRTELDNSIISKREALDLHPPGDPERATFLVELSDSLYARTRAAHSSKDLEEVITLRREALELRPLAHPDRPSSLSKLAGCLIDQFHSERTPLSLEEAITLVQEALELCPPGHPDRLSSLHTLARCQHEQFREEGTRADLEGAITLAREALELCPPGHPDRSSCLHNLAIYFSSWFDEDGQMEDISEASTFGRAAVDLRAPGHLSWHLTIESLFVCLCNQYRKDKAGADLENISTLRRAMLEFQPQYHPERSSLVTSLEHDIAEMLDKSRTVVDLDKAITLGRAMTALHLPGHPHRFASLRKLINCLKERFQKQDAIADLDELIILHRDILDINPSSHRVRSSLLHDLASCLWHKFQRQREMSTLEKAIDFERVALQLHEGGDIDHAESLHTLVHFFGEYIKEGNMIDLDELVALGRSILQLGPSKHPDYATSLRNLAVWISDLFDRQPGKVDIQEVITFTTSVLRFFTPGQPDRSALLRIIGAYRRKEQKLGAEVDRGGIRKLIRDAVNDTLEDLPTRLLNTLTGRLCNRAQLISDFENSQQFKELLKSATPADPFHPAGCIRQTVSTYFQYATLSHRWEWPEPLLHDIHGQVIYDMDLTYGIIKLQSFCTASRDRNFTWAWSDTCCIDKESSAELQESIGSMFSWYRRSALTIVYLADVSDDDALTSSEWFERGWTLQELLAPSTLLFFMQDWSLYRGHMASNHKEDSTVLTKLAKVTNIASHHLTHFLPGTDDARLRLQWASTRRTMRSEDVAYSLFGVFDLRLSIFYGEGREKALGRLLGEIILQSGDISVLDWVGEASSCHSCFPARITVYQTLPCPSTYAGKILLSSFNTHELEALNALFHSLLTIDAPQYIGRLLELPCITHRVTAMQLKECRTTTSQYVYELRAEGLSSMEIISPNEFPTNSPIPVSYVLIRPWHSKLLDPSKVGTAAMEQLVMALGQPFNALLLQKLSRNEYQRVASSSIIIARPADAMSILCSNLQILKII
ncbi:hypothetical protein V8B97DRAFT_2010153 [Scleroderma yunnanense]